MPRILLAVAVIAGLGAGTAEVRADKRVDWSEYLEPPGARSASPRQTTPKVADGPVATADKPAKKSAGKAPRAKAKPKAARTKARR